MAAVKAEIRLSFSGVTVEGEEHLKEIPPGKKVVVATTHISDYDMPLAIYALGDKFELVVANASDQHAFRKSPFGNIGMRISGTENFRGIDYRDNYKGPDFFNPANYRPIEKDLREGKTAVVAAHNPVFDYRLPERGGYAAVYVAELADAVVLPVALDVQSSKKIGTGSKFSDAAKSLWERPEARVIIGAPLAFQRLEGVEQFEAIMRTRHDRSAPRPAAEEITFVRGISRKLKENSRLLMKALAVLLPPEKRGAWDRSAD